MSLLKNIVGIFYIAKLIIVTSASFPLMTEFNIESPKAEKQKLQKLEVFLHLINIFWKPETDGLYFISICN